MPGSSSLLSHSHNYIAVDMSITIVAVGSPPGDPNISGIPSPLGRQLDSNILSKLTSASGASLSSHTRGTLLPKQIRASKSHEDFTK